MSLIRETQTITDAAAVRRLLKAKGFTCKLSVRRWNPPLGGNGYFSVELPIPEGVSVVSSGGSDKPGTRYGSSDGGQHAALLSRLDETLKQIQLENP